MTALLDAHVHFWDPTARHHDWLAVQPPLRRRFGPEDLDTGTYELTGVVFVQADCRDIEASLPNVACKLSGLATEAGPGWTADDVRPYLEHALEVFGPQRCMIASDWPVATLAATAGQWFDVVLGVITHLPAQQRAAVLSGTAAATYGLTGPSLETPRNTDAGSAVRR
jgi:predicted TIM-barrel fold metal-dependent hydrolase